MIIFIMLLACGTITRPLFVYLMMLSSCPRGGGFIIINRRCLFLRGRRKSFGCFVAGRLPYYHHDGTMTTTRKIMDCRISRSNSTISLHHHHSFTTPLLSSSSSSSSSLIGDGFTTTSLSNSKYFSSNSANTDNDKKEQQLEQQQQQQQQDLYEILGLPRQFEISSQEMKNAYRSLMNKYHPDKQQQQQQSSSSSKEEEEDDDDDEMIDDIDDDMMASKVTNAYQVLKEPHTRAKHMLELVGLPLDETTQTEMVVGAEFLLEVMEIREDIDSTTSDNTKKLKQIQNNINMKISIVINELNDAFDNEQDYNKATKLTSQLQYLRRMQTAIHEKM